MRSEGFYVNETGGGDGIKQCEDEYVTTLTIVT